MKRLLLWTLLSIVVSSCDENRKDLATIDGTWQVKTLSIQFRGQDSLISRTGITLNFAKCSTKTNNLRDCQATVAIDGQSYLFNYQVDRQSVAIIPLSEEFVKPGYSFLADRLAGKYSTQVLNDSNLSLRLESECTVVSTPRNCQHIVELIAIR